MPHFSPSPQKFFNHSIDYIILDKSIKLKGKQIIGTTGFSTEVKNIPIRVLPFNFPTVEYAMGPIQADDVEVRINVKSKKFNRLLELFNKRKRISFEMVAKSLKIVSTGMITEVSYSEEGCIGFTYCPEVFSIL